MFIYYSDSHSLTLCCSHKLPIWGCHKHYCRNGRYGKPAVANDAKHPTKVLAEKNNKIFYTNL